MADDPENSESTEDVVNELPLANIQRLKENWNSDPKYRRRVSTINGAFPGSSVIIREEKPRNGDSKGSNFGFRSISRKSSFLYVMEPELEDEYSELEMDQCGWGWVVVIAATLCNGTVFGVLLSYGVLFKNMLGTLSEEFSVETEYVALQASLVGSVADGCAFLFSPMASVLMDRFSPRKVALVGCVIATLGMFSTAFVRRIELLYVTYGLTLGLGSSLIMTPSLVMPAMYFDKHLGLVNGLSTCGNAIFTIVLPYLWVVLLENFKLHTFMIISGFYVVCCLGSLTFVSRPPASKTRSKDCCSGFKVDKNLWTNKNFVIWLVAIILSHFTMYVPIVHMVNHTSLILGENHEMGPEIVQMIFGGVSGISRLVIGPVSDLKWLRRHRLIFHQLSFLIGGFTTVLIPFCTEFWQLCLISVCLGLSQSLMIAQFAPVIIDLVGLRNGAKGVGFTMGCLSVPLMTAPPIGGVLYDTFGNYTIAFHAAGIPALVAFVLLLFVKVRREEDPESEVADFRQDPGTPVIQRKLSDRRYSRRGSLSNIAFH